MTLGAVDPQQDRLGVMVPIVRFGLIILRVRDIRGRFGEFGQVDVAFFFPVLKPVHKGFRAFLGRLFEISGDPQSQCRSGFVITLDESVLYFLRGLFADHIRELCAQFLYLFDGALFFVTKDTCNGISYLG